MNYIREKAGRPDFICETRQYKKRNRQVMKMNKLEKLISFGLYRNTTVGCKQNDTSFYFKLMRQTLIILTFILSLISCSNSDTTKATTDSLTKQKVDTAKSSRQPLIDELKRIQQIIASNDKEATASVFSFPLSDTSFSVYIDDTTYYDEFKANGNQTTKAMFLHHFNEISESIWLNQIKELFSKVQPDSLQFKDILEHEAYIKAEPCFYSYKIEVIKDSVVLRMDMKSNEQFKSKKSNDEIPENSSEICEHSLWWNFKFDGQKLHFQSISGAG
jgi:hypothetical protein